MGAGTMHKHPESKVTKTGALSTTPPADALDPGKMGVIAIPEEGELSGEDGWGDLTGSHGKLAGKLETT